VTLVAKEIARGESLGKYEILRKLATGGMAEIYLARVRGEAGFEKTVVLKRILPNFAEDPTFVQMFLDEARLAATLQHSNIADVYDVGQADGSYFFTMEFIYGEDARSIRIASRTANNPIPRRHALAIVHGALSGLHYAHEKIGPHGPLNLVHRDVSSSNILVSFDGAVKLVDFGIARATVRQTKTLTGTLKGKIPYMSPEQCRNQALDRRSDLFSLGVVLYELTVGRRPFRGESDFDILDQIVNRGAPPPMSIDSFYPPSLQAIVMRALARKPDDRYQTGEELMHDLEEFMSNEGGWVSPMNLGRYMRTLFADKVAAWESAAEQGSTLGDHVASTITSESMRAQRTTPVSAFTAQPELPAEPPRNPHSAVIRKQLRPGIPRWLWIAMLLVTAGAGVFVWKAVINAPPDASRPPAATVAPTTMPASPPPAPPPPAPVAPAPPAEPPAAATTPPPPEPPSEPAKVTTPTITTVHRPAKVKAAPKPEPVKPAPVASQPAPPPPPPPPPKPEPKPDKEKTWDRNSLSLPK
jgi:serine/threonine protein kinase